jgi:predicted Rossmann fold nucleotide-binding protein DprA/Smf involved in DNA uptake
MLKTVAPPPTASHLLEWAALTMTPGLAPKRARKLAERFGSADAVFRASLTELESAGIQVVSAQALATGKSAELAREEIARVAAAKGKTVAVFETGVNVVGTFPAPQNFPIRNRILSGMSVDVLVVEAAEYSGRRITARCALEQNRDVFVVPGNVTDKNSWGPNTLIERGAKPVATWKDVWEDPPTEVRLALTPTAPAESSASASASLFPDEGLPPHEKRILFLLRSNESTHIDEIVEKLETELSSSEIFAALFEWELAGKVRPMPGKHFEKSF